VQACATVSASCSARTLAISIAWWGIFSLAVLQALPSTGKGREDPNPGRLKTDQAAYQLLEEAKEKGELQHWSHATAKEQVVNEVLGELESPRTAKMLRLASINS